MRPATPPRGTQMSAATKQTLGPLLGTDTRTATSDVWNALYEAADGVGVEHCPVLAVMFTAMAPIAEHISFLDARIYRYDERVYGRIDQLRRELRARPGEQVNDPAASHRILAEDAQEAADDTAERRALHQELARLCALTGRVHAQLTGDESAGPVVRAVAAAG